MTNPRDDITGLSERLQKPVMLHSDAAQTNAERKEAATQLDSLLKERDALYQRLDAAAQMDREKTVRVVEAEARADALQARVKELEKQSDPIAVATIAAFEDRAKKLEAKCADLERAGERREAIARLAHRFWSIHPKELQDMGITREQFYTREMTAILASGLVQDEPSEGKK